MFNFNNFKEFEMYWNCIFFEVLEKVRLLLLFYVI